MAKLSFLLGPETTRGGLDDTKVDLVDGQVYFAYDASAEPEDARIYLDTSAPDGTLQRIRVNSYFSDVSSGLFNTTTGNLFSAGTAGRPVYFYNGIPQAITSAISVSYGGTGTATAPVQGGVIYGASTSAYGSTAAGTSGQLLQSAGTGEPTWITATNAATASTIVKRDTSGNFSAGTITAALSGNATTATALETPRTILVNLAATTAASFNGSADITPGVKGTLSVIQGGTGLASLTSGSALIGNGKNAVTLRAITNNTSATAVTANTNLITANTLYYHKGNSNLVIVGTITSGTWNGSTVAIAYGGTGGTTAAAARSNLHYSAATIAAIDNDTTTNWGAKGPLSLDWYSAAGQITDQPSTYGFVLNFSKKNNASEVHQLWITQPGGDLLHRGGNGSGWSGTWKTLLDSSNFTTHLDGTYVNVSGDTMTGKLTVPTIKLSSTSATKHIEFTRDSYNYITAPTGGAMLFCADGADLNLSACTMSIAGTYVRFNRAPLIYSSTAIADNVPARLNFQVHQSDNDVTATGYIACYDDSDNLGYGTNMVIVPGSNLVMGGGESALTVYNNSLTSSSSEATYLTSDTYIYFVSNCGTNSGANAKTLAIDNNGYFYPATDGTGAIGINNNRWSYLMGRTIVGTSGYTYGTTLPKGNYVGRLFLLPA